MLRINLSHDAVRFLKKRDAKQFVQLVEAIISLCENVRPPDSVSLANGRHFRKDAGEFRIIYSFDKEKLSVSVIGNRNDGAAYRELERKK